MITMQEVPTGFSMSASLRELSEWLYKNSDLKPENTAPFNMSDKESVVHKERCSEYKEKLSQFNDLLQSELDAEAKSNSEMLLRMSDARTSQNQLTTKISSLIKIELDRLSALSGIEDIELYTEWRSNTEQNLWRLYGFGL